MLVVPEGAVKKAYKTLLTLILVFSLLYPLKGKGVKISDFSEIISGIGAEKSENEIEDYKNTAVIAAAEGETERYLEDALLSAGSECTCSVKCDYNGSSITVVSVDIDGKISEEEKAVLYGKIREITDERTELRFNGERYE